MEEADKHIITFTTHFKELSLSIINRYSSRIFVANFGVKLNIVVRIWVYFLSQHAATYFIQPIYLLWALFWMKVYPTSDTLTSTLKRDRKTLMKWIKVVITLLFKSFKNSLLVCFPFIFYYPFSEDFLRFPSTLVFQNGAKFLLALWSMRLNVQYGRLQSTNGNTTLTNKNVTQSSMK